MTEYNQLKGNTYEEFVLNNLLNKYDAVYYFKETPEDIIAKTKLYSKYEGIADKMITNLFRDKLYFHVLTNQ